MNKYYKMCKDQHLCVICQKPVERLENGKYPTRCKSCRDYYNAEQRQKHKAARAKQTCSLCHKPTEINPKTQKPYNYCTECKRKATEYYKKVTAERKAKHICTWCGSPVEQFSDGKYKAKCEKCLAKQRAYFKKYRGKE